MIVRLTSWSHWLLLSLIRPYSRMHDLRLWETLLAAKVPGSAGAFVYHGCFALSGTSKTALPMTKHTCPLGAPVARFEDMHRTSYKSQWSIHIIATLSALSTLLMVHVTSSALLVVRYRTWPFLSSPPDHAAIVESRDTGQAHPCLRSKDWSRWSDR